MFEIFILYILKNFCFFLNYNADGRSHWLLIITQWSIVIAVSEVFIVLTHLTVSLPFRAKFSFTGICLSFCSGRTYTG